MLSAYAIFTVHRWRQEGSFVISTEEANATERRNLLCKRHRSQIPPLASLGRDDKRGRAARSIDKRERRAAEGVGPYGRALKSPPSVIFAKAKCHLPHLALPNGGGKGFPCHFDRGSEATEWRNLLYKRRRSQIPPLASLGRDDKRGKMARSG